MDCRLNEDVTIGDECKSDRIETAKKKKKSQSTSTNANQRSIFRAKLNPTGT